MDPGPPPVGWVSDGANTYPGQYAAKAAETISGFTLVSETPPGIIDYVVRFWYPETTYAEGTAPEDAPPSFSEDAIGRIMGPGGKPLMGAESGN